MRQYLIIVTLISVIILSLSMINCNVEIMIDADVVVPDSLSATTKVSIFGIVVQEREVIGIGETVYVMDPKTKEWAESNEYPDVSSMASLDVVIKILDSITRSTILDDESVDGEICNHIKGSIDSVILNELGFEGLSMDMDGYGSYSLNTSELEVSSELWISTEDYLVRRLTIEGWDAAVSDETDTTLSIIMEFTDFNKPVTVPEP